MAEKREATSDVQLSEDLSHVAELPKDQGSDFMELNGVLVMGESEGYDIALGVGAWHVGGGRNGKWKADDAMMNQTTLVMVPQDKQGRMHDSFFVGNRLDASEWTGKVQIIQKPDHIIWKAGNRQFISRPPYWEAKGEHLGVDCNLTLGGIGNASRCYGLWPDLPTTTRAGYEQRCWVEGTITVKGKVYTLEKAYGIHDQMTFGHSYDHMELIREPYTYIWCLSGSVQIFLFCMPKAGVSYGRVYVDDQEIPFSHNEITMDELELWTDPETGMQVPVRWHVNMKSTGGGVDMIVGSGGRGIYCVVNKKGYNMRYGLNARTSGSVVLSDGRSVQIPDILSYVEWGRTVMSLESGAPSAA
ncbi:MAG: hypothetical protein ABIK92_05885 [Pseudomonadota bacterium]